MGAVLAVPLTLLFECILLDTERRTRWMSVFLGGDLDEDEPAESDEPDAAVPGPEPSVEPQQG